MDAEKITREFPKGLLNWYVFRKNSSALLITEKSDDVLSELLAEKCGNVVIADIDKARQQEFLVKHTTEFDYIVLVGVIEKLKVPVQSLGAWKKLLNSNGHMLIGAENRLGIKYFCGDRDPYTGRNFDGIEHYNRVKISDWEQIDGRCYSRAELKDMLAEAGFGTNRFYSVLPNLSEPQLIYAESYMPEEELAMRYFPLYNYPDSVFLEEEYLYTDLVKNGMFHTMANSYLIEYSAQEDFDKALHVTVSLDRGPENALATIIKDDNGKRLVEKVALYQSGMSKLEIMQDNAKDLKSHNVPMVDSEIVDGKFVMPYIDGEIALNYLKRIAGEDKDLFIKEMDKFRDIILNSSDVVEEDANLGRILKRGYVDMVPINCFHTSDGYMFYDQEFYYENYPANVMILRTVMFVYMGTMDQELEKIIPMQFFMDRYNLSKNRQSLEKKSTEFTDGLRNQKVLWQYNSKRKRDNFTIGSNRQKINYSQTDYQRMFVNILQGAEDKKVIVFGSGLYAKQFLSQFGNDYNIHAILDNNESKWGQNIEGIEIQSPDMLNSLKQDEIRVIICVKNYAGIARQLEKMGIEDYRIYDSYIDHPSKPKIIFEKKNEVSEENESDAAESVKKYHVGYIAGVFDLFHIGHLNMFKRAKEQCEFLIVGVVSDEGVRKNKGVEPFVPFEERLEMVASCKYVDKAVEIPFGLSGTKDAHRMYQFDCQFSGSDYVNSPAWLDEKTYLEKHGAQMVFFPYTESTSSTKLKKLINEKLI